MTNSDNTLEGTEIIPPVLSCLLTKDKETGRWIGHCLDFDIVTSGLDDDLAWKNLKEVVTLHVENCFTHWQPGLRRSASQERWQVFNRLCDPAKPFRQEKIHFHLVAAPIPDEQWMKAFSLPEGIDGNIESTAVQ